MCLPGITTLLLFCFPNILSLFLFPVSQVPVHVPGSVAIQNAAEDALDLHAEAVTAIIASGIGTLGEGEDESYCSFWRLEIPEKEILISEMHNIFPDAPSASIEMIIFVFFFDHGWTG